MSTIGFLALGYGLIWFIIGAYVFFVSRRQAALRRQVDQLQMELDEAADKLGRERPSVAAAPAATTDAGPSISATSA